MLAYPTSTSAQWESAVYRLIIERKASSLWLIHYRIKGFVHKGDDSADDEEAGPAGQPQAESIAVLQAGTQNKMQSQLTTVEFFTANEGLTISVYDYDSEEATAVQAMYLSQSTPTATYPVLVRPTTVPHTIP